MSDTTLTAENRAETGKRPAGRLRREGKVPAVVYGLGSEPVSVTVPARELSHILAGESGANTVITLRVGGQEQLTLARQIQRHPVRGELLHVDFIRVSADQPVTAEVTVNLTGEPEGVRMGGMLEQQLFTVSIEAKPADIPTAIEHDVSELGLGDQLRIGELAIPPGVTVHHEPDELVAAVAVPRGLAAGEAEEGVEGEAAEGAGAPAAEGEAAESE